MVAWGSFDFNQTPSVYWAPIPQHEGCQLIRTLPERADVAIVGGGPAGSILAYELARQGVRSLLLEKMRLPRYKTCGGGVQQRVVRLVGCDISPVERAAVDRMTFTYRLARPFVKEASRPVVRMVMRDAFDHFLLERAARAGTEVIDRVRADRIIFEPDSAAIQTSSGTVRATIVVGADGANSTVARDSGLGLDHDRDLAIEAEIETPEGRFDQWSRSALIDLGSLPSGYGWLFPKGDMLSVGVGGPIQYRELLRPYFDRLMGYLGLSASSIRRFSGHQLTLRRIGSPIVGNRALLLGDAAGLVDPFTGEGLYGAVRSAQLAVRPVLSALSSGLPSLRQYQDSIDSLLMPELTEAQTILRVFNRMPGLAHRIAGGVPLVWKELVQIMLGERTYLDIGRGKLRWIWRALDRLPHGASI